MGFSGPRIALSVDSVNDRRGLLMWWLWVVAVQPTYGRFLFTSYDVA